MKSPFKSIRWRLQAWHGLMLLAVLLAFGVTSYYLAVDNRMRRIDQEIERRAGPFVAMMNRMGGPPGERGGGGGRFRSEMTNDPMQGLEQRPERPVSSDDPRDREPKKGGPGLPPEKRQEGPRRMETRRFEGQGPDIFRQMLTGGIPMPPDIQKLIDEAGSGHFYMVIWSPEMTELKRSPNTPSDLPAPSAGNSSSDGILRMRGGCREHVHGSKRGGTILVGCDVTSDLAELNRLAGLLSLAGAGVLLLGLAGGWWISTRAIRPIADISAAADKIAAGDLSERIPVTDAASELGSLTAVLNHTFDRLEKAFQRQAQFTADASHELRTPVSVVLSQTQTALKRDRTPEEYRETIAACQRSAQRMAQLIESLLELARLDDGQSPLKREQCDLSTLVRDCLELLSPMIQERKIQIVTDLAPSTPAALDGHRMSQVITNLVSNAVHYNREGGSIRVKTWGTAGFVNFSVEDTGIGIDVEDLPHVFDRFFRADRSRSAPSGRTGLGLAICKSIVDAHGGRIEVSSQKGVGTVFTVALPS